MYIFLELFFQVESMSIYIFNIFVMLSHGGSVIPNFVCQWTHDKNFLYEVDEIFIFVILPINWWKIWKPLGVRLIFNKYHTEFSRIQLLHLVRIIPV